MHFVFIFISDFFIVSMRYINWPTLMIKKKNIIQTRCGYKVFSIRRHYFISLSDKLITYDFTIGRLITNSYSMRAFEYI